MKEEKTNKVDEEQTVPVVVRLSRTELEALKDETGATADATAIACFVRKNIRRAGRAK